MGDSGYKIQVDASQKFDYFVTGAAGVALSYVIQSYDRKPGDPWWLLVDVALSTLFAAFAAGLLHLSTTVEVLRRAAHLQRTEETLSDLRDADRKRAGVYIPGADVSVPPNQVGQAIEMTTEELKKMRLSLAPITIRQNRSQTVRNWGVVISLALLTAWKILQGLSTG